MKNQDILDSVVASFHKITQKNEQVITIDSVRDDVDGWDSLNHVAVMVDLEKTFGFRFQAEEIRTFASIQQICDAISQRKK